MSDNDVECSNKTCSEYGNKQTVEPWSAVMCGPCGEWLRTPEQVAEAMEHRPEYWEQYMGLGAPMPGISP